MPAPTPAPRGALHDGVRFPATFAFNDWKPIDVDTQAMFDLIADVQRCAGPIRIVGHTDERGGDIVNDRVAIARAGEIRRLFEQQGLDRHRMEIGSAGAARPADGVDELPDRDARALNRRVTVQCD
ncbi:MAG: OmpA family protein [Myxococcota bacterium]